MGRSRPGGAPSRPHLLLDTNIFIEHYLKQERADECLPLLNAVARGDYEASMTRFALHSIEFNLDRRGYTDELLICLNDLREAIGLSVYDTTLEEDLAIVALTKKLPLDFDDTLHYYVAKQHNFVLVSFDHNFDQTDIARVEPAAILEQTAA